MNIVIKVPGKFVAQINKNKEMYELSEDSPLKILEAEKELTLKFYPINLRESGKVILPQTEVLSLVNGKLVSLSQNAVINNYNDEDYEVIFSNRIIKKEGYKDKSFVLDKPFSNLEIYAKNFGRPEIVIIGNLNAIKSYEMQDNFYGAKNFMFENHAIICFNLDEKANTKNFYEKENVKEIDNLQSQNKIYIINLNTLEMVYESYFNLISVNSNKQEISILSKDESILKTGTITDLKFKNGFSYETTKVHTAESGTLKHLIPKKIIPLAFFQAVKTENFKETRYFLNEDFNKKLTDENLVTFFANIPDLKVNPFITTDTNFFYVLSSNNKYLPIEFVIENNKITNIKTEYSL